MSHEQFRTGHQEVAFNGWQESPWGEDIALYDVIAPDHPFYGSTLTALELRRLNLAVPATPPLPNRGLPRGFVSKQLRHTHCELVTG